MLIFWDAEFTDFIDCELISIGMVSEDGQHELYLEVQDFDLSKCRAFVQSTVWSQLGQVAGASVSRGGWESAYETGSRDSPLLPIRNMTEIYWRMRWRESTAADSGS